MSSDEEKQRAYDIIEEVEISSCRNMKLRQDTINVLTKLRHKRIKLAISTRNCATAVDHFITLFPPTLWYEQKR